MLPTARAVTHRTQSESVNQHTPVSVMSVGGGGGGLLALIFT